MRLWQKDRRLKEIHVISAMEQNKLTLVVLKGVRHFENFIKSKRAQIDTK